MKVNQTKNDILNDNVMTMKTHMILSYYTMKAHIILSHYTPAPGAAPTFHPKQVQAVCFSTAPKTS